MLVTRTPNQMFYCIVQVLIGLLKPADLPDRRGRNVRPSSSSFLADLPENFQHPTILYSWQPLTMCSIILFCSFISCLVPIGRYALIFEGLVESIKKNLAVSLLLLYERRLQPQIWNPPPKNPSKESYDVSPTPPWPTESRWIGCFWLERWE